MKRFISIFILLCLVGCADTVYYDNEEIMFLSENGYIKLAIFNNDMTSEQIKFMKNKYSKYTNHFRNTINSYNFDTFEDKYDNHLRPEEIYYIGDDGHLKISVVCENLSKDQLKLVYDFYIDILDELIEDLDDF